MPRPMPWISPAFGWPMVGASPWPVTGRAMTRPRAFCARYGRPPAAPSIPPWARTITPPTTIIFMWIWGCGGCAADRKRVIGVARRMALSAAIPIEQSPRHLAPRQQQIGGLASAAVAKLEAAQLCDFVVGAQGDLDFPGLQLDGADAGLGQGLLLRPTLVVETQQGQALEDRVLDIQAAIAVVVILGQLGKAIGRAVLIAEQFAAVVDRS